MRLLRLGWVWIQIVGGMGAFIALAWVAASFLLHLKLLTVQTGSMRPSFKPGDALIMQHQDAHALQPGMVVSYHSSRNPNELVTHRIYAVKTDSFQTKGDALNQPDPWVRNTLLAGKVRVVLPGMGHVLGWVQSWPGLIAVVYVPAAAILITELYRFEQYFRRLRLYRLQPRQVL